MNDKANTAHFKVGTAVQGRTRAIQINGDTYWIRPNYKAGLPGLYEEDPKQDPYSYVLPDGTTYTHVSEYGCLLMILKHAGGDEWAEFIMPEFQNAN